MMKLIVNYPTEQQEADILKQHSQQLNLGEVLKMKFKLFPHLLKLTAIKENAMSELMVLADYINKIVRLTCQWPQLYMGVTCADSY